MDAMKLEGSLQEANALFMETSMNAANKTNSIQSSKENKDVGSSSHNYACTICAFPCQTKGSLVKHMQLHEHTCSICNGLFESSKNLQNHMTTSHGEVKFLCKLCNTTFWAKSDLRKHFMTKHLDPFCNICNICNQEFQTMYAITRHMHRVHSNVCVACTICKCDFTSFKALKSHNKHVHLKSGFQCGICGRRDIFNVVDLETHLRRHKDKQRVLSMHVCTTCGQCFDKKPHLSEHMIKYHGKTNPYVCPVCKRSFEKRSNQIQHILTHMHNVYACDICGAKFPRRSSLVSHRKMHPGPLGPLPDIPVTGIVSKFVRDYLNSNKGLADP
ncbi:uncharacterized protein [Anoplolepis gracilipes]|uniref:uncharacterized protein n=1 Tax=Anoplolepis gracilipes TaxID=354296 RepID=UPI003BA27C08